VGIRIYHCLFALVETGRTGAAVDDVPALHKSWPVKAEV
jgi:hypothetical protein